MTTPYDKVKQKFDELVADYKKAVEDGKLSFSDALSLLLHGSFSIAEILQQYTEYDFETRKKVGVDLATQFYNEVIAPIDLPLPGFIEAPLDKAVGMIIPTLVESLYDAIDDLIYKKLH